MTIKLAVTGASGFVGQHFLALAARERLDP